VGVTAAGCELLGVGSVQGDGGAGCVEDVRAGAELEEEEEPEELGSRRGSGKVGVSGPDGVGISDRDEFRPANTCWTNAVLVGGKGVRGDGAGWMEGWGAVGEVEEEEAEEPGSRPGRDEFRPASTVVGGAEAGAGGLGAGWGADVLASSS